MRIRRIRKLRVNSYDFDVVWCKDHNGASFDFRTLEIVIGVKSGRTADAFQNICHELQEICACEMHARFQRPDVGDDYIFVYDHRQHDTMVNMFAGLLAQFIV